MKLLSVPVFYAFVTGSGFGQVAAQIIFQRLPNVAACAGGSFDACLLKKLDCAPTHAAA